MRDSREARASLGSIRASPRRGCAANLMRMTTDNYRPLGLRLLIAIDLADWLRTVISRDWDLESRSDAMVLALFSQLSGTYRATAHLVEAGFGDEAIMLTRPLFEGTVDLHWIALHEDESTRQLEEVDLEAA